jgi:hypothetical protein
VSCERCARETTCRRGQSARHSDRSWVICAPAPPSSPYAWCVASHALRDRSSDCSAGPTQGSSRSPYSFSILKYETAHRCGQNKASSACGGAGTVTRLQALQATQPLELSNHNNDSHVASASTQWRCSPTERWLSCVVLPAWRRTHPMRESTSSATSDCTAGCGLAPAAAAAKSSAAPDRRLRRQGHMRRRCRPQPALPPACRSGSPCSTGRCAAACRGSPASPAARSPAIFRTNPKIHAKACVLLSWRSPGETLALVTHSACGYPEAPTSLQPTK